MINLLPYDNKKQIRAAQHNVILIKCLTFLMFGVLFIAIACTVAYSFLKNEDISNKKAAYDTTNTDPSSSNLISQANKIKSDLAVAKSILDQQIQYSDVIIGITSALPNGSIIENISVNSSNTKDPIKMSVRATSSDQGQIIKNALANSKIFSNPIILGTALTQSVSSKYPYSIDMTVTIKKASSL